MPAPTLPPAASAHKLMEKAALNLKGFSSAFKYPTLRVISADREDGKGTVVFRLKTEENLDNTAGNVHGGAIATMVDLFSSFALWLHSPLEKGSPWSSTGVSQSLQVLYLAATPIGSWIEIENKVLSVGKTLAVIQTDIFIVKGPEGGRIKKTISGTHTKVDVKVPTKSKM